MKLRAAALLLPLVIAFSAQAPADQEAGPTPSLMDKTLELLHLKHAPQPAATPVQTQQEAAPTPNLVDKTLEILHLEQAPHPAAGPLLMNHQIEMKLALAPAPVKLSENRQVTVIVSLFNRSKKFVHLNFPTSQRIEILVRDASGKVVNTWSEDQSFTNDPAAVTVNPGERLEYTASVATREMTAGQPYVIEASFPSYGELKIQQRLVPEK